MGSHMYIALDSDGHTYARCGWVAEVKMHRYHQRRLDVCGLVLLSDNSWSVYTRDLVMITFLIPPFITLSTHPTSPLTPAPPPSAITPPPSLSTHPSPLRGATIEKCIELLISDPSQLWGGFSLMVGPHAQDHPPFSVLHASKDQVLQFFLTMYKSFAHPLILIRLLLHRLSLKDTLNLFDWSKDSSSFSNSSTTHLASIPSMQINILNLIGRWLETFPDDFVECMELKKEVERLLGHLKMAAGPYLPHSNKLRYFVCVCV